MSNAMGQAQRAYSAARGTTRTPRRLEYEALAGISARIRASADAGATGFPALAAAIHDNRRIWTVFAAQAASSANPLPEQLRAGIISLAEFTFGHSAKVLARTASVDPILEINASIMRGLRDRER